MGENNEKFAAAKQVDEEAPMDASTTAPTRGPDPAEDQKVSREEMWKILGILFAIVAIGTSMVNAPVGHSGKYPHDQLTPVSFFLIFIAFTICIGFAYMSMVIEPSVSTVKNVFVIVSLFVAMAIILKQFSVYV